MKKVTLAKSAGFCFGVRRAIQLALDIAKSNKNVYMLGDIVHNPRVVGDIKRQGIKKLKKLSKRSSGTLIIRAHGAPKVLFAQAKALGYKIIDVTCPMVKEIQSIAKGYEAKGYTVIIFGDAEHDEVIGIKGNLKRKPIIISAESQIDKCRFAKLRKAVVVVQSTQNLEKITKLMRRIKRYVKNLVFFNTICRPTRKKQKEIKQLPLKNDVMIVIGARSSANTKRLYEISKAINPHTYWVNSKRAIKKEWFAHKSKIGISAGASTPDYIINEIRTYLERL